MIMVVTVMMVMIMVMMVILSRPYIGELRQLVDGDEGGAARYWGRDRFCQQKNHLGYIFT